MTNRRLVKRKRTPVQTALKRKREEEPQDEVRELEEPPKKLFIKDTTQVPDLHPQPSLSTSPPATWTDDITSAKKRKREAAQEEELRKLNPCPEKRFVVNAAVLPECLPRPASISSSGASGTSPAREPLPEEPLMINGLTCAEFLSVYRWVVEPRLVTSTGTQRLYSLMLGCTIKQRLWEKLNCPSFIEEDGIHDSEQIRYTEKFSTPTWKSFAPCFNLDISEEPKPEQPNRKRKKT